MTASYTNIVIIFNPNSTGNGEQLAKDLQHDLQQQGCKTPIKLIPTEHAGHAETIAYEQALASKRSLVISASGDGGYHEVVNGIMRAQKQGAQVVSGLLPAGNANDHHGAVHSDTIVDSILQRKEQQIDILTVQGKVRKKTFMRYAHSYIGIGLTPTAGQELNKVKLNWLNELYIVVKVLFLLHPVRVTSDGKTRAYDSIIFSNIHTMSKVLKVSKQADPRDGSFEMTAFRRRSKLWLIATLIRSSLTGLHGAQQITNYTFETTSPLLLQCDGEITTLDAQSEVRIGIEPQALTCVV